MKMNNIVDLIKNNDNFVILSHINPDGDSIGSSLGLYNALVKYNKNVDVVISNDVPDKFSYLKGFINIKNDSNKKYDYAIIVDTASIDRINVSDNLLKNINNFMLIDHHISNTKYYNNYYIDGNSASCSMIIYDIICKLGIDIDRDIGECILNGIITDTGGFRNKNTDINTFDYVIKLCKYVDITYVFDKALGNINFSEYNLKKITMDRMEFYFDNKIAYSYVTDDDLYDTGGSKYDCSSLVNIAREISNVEVSIFTRFFNNGIRISLRSKNIDVNRVLSKFGGGGHMYAAGLTLDNVVDFDNIKNRLISEVENSINEWINSSK